MGQKPSCSAWLWSTVSRLSHLPIKDDASLVLDQQLLLLILEFSKSLAPSQVPLLVKSLLLLPLLIRSADIWMDLVKEPITTGRFNNNFFVNVSDRLLIFADSPVPSLEWVIIQGKSPFAQKGCLLRRALLSMSMFQPPYQELHADHPSSLIKQENVHSG